MRKSLPLSARPGRGTVCQATGPRPGIHGIVKHISACGLPRRPLSCAGSTLAPAGMMEVQVTDHPVADRFRPGRLRIARSPVPHGGDGPYQASPAERRCEGGSRRRCSVRGVWSGTSMATAGSRAGSPKKCRGAATATRSRCARFQVPSKRRAGTRLVGCSVTPRLPRLAVLAQATGSSLPQSLRHDG